MGFLLYFLVVQASLLSRVVGGGNVHKAVDGAGNSVIWGTYRAVHLTIGLVIMIPTLVVAFFPFMTHFQVCTYMVFEVHRRLRTRGTFSWLPPKDHTACVERHSFVFFELPAAHQHQRKSE